MLHTRCGFDNVVLGIYFRVSVTFIESNVIALRREKADVNVKFMSNVSLISAAVLWLFDM